MSPRDVAGQAVKCFTQGDTIGAVVEHLASEQTTEHPTTINALERFNVWPEVVLAVLHRTYLDFASWLRPSATFDTCYGTCNCFDVEDEGKILNTCTGLGHPIFFYLEAVWHAAGLHAAALFVICSHLADGSHIAGIFGMIMAACNYADLCRYHSAPALRESFGFPFFVTLLAVEIGVLRRGFARIVDVVGIVLATFLFALSWQLAQFVLLTHAITLSATFLLGYIPARLQNTLHLCICTGYVDTNCTFGSHSQCECR